VTTYGDALYGAPNLYGLQRPVYSVPAGNIALPLISNAYLIDPFVAVATDYSTITLTWTLPDPTTNTPMTEFRLISNRYGYPVDENDGAVLVDVTSVQEFGSGYLDQSVIPGTFHYYAVYINTGSSWVRAGFAACLMPASNGYASTMFNLLPEYLRDIIDTELTQTPGPSQVIAPQLQPSGVTVSNPYAFPVQVTLTGGTVTDVVVDGIDLGPNVLTFWVAGTGNVTVYYSATPSWTWLNVPAGGANSFLQQFLAVAGWSLDYLKTQYDYTLDSLNDPMLMPLSDLVQLCDELGLPFSPEVPAYFMRKAAANWAVIMQQRGSVAGIAEHASVLSGFELDLQTSANLMLENDQSAPQHPRYPWWSPSITYIEGERVTWGPFTSVPPEWSPNRTYPASVSVLYGGLAYQSAESVPANIPPSTSGTYWTQLTGPYVYQALAGNLDTMPTGSVSSSADWGLLDNRDNYGKYAGLDGSPSAWTPGSAYAAGDRVTYPVADGTLQSYMCLSAVAAQPNWVSTNGYSTTNLVIYDSQYYYCTATLASSGSGNPTPAADTAHWEPYTALNPSGTTAATSQWLPVYDNLVIQNSALAGRHAPSTWEAVYPNEGASYSGATYSLVESIGLPDPLAYSYDWTHNGFRAYNMSGTASELMWLRSVIRQASDVSSSNTNLTPDPELVIQHGIPVPEAMGEWTSSTRYTPGDVVSYGGLNYLALRASTNASPASFTSEWSQLGHSNSVPLMISGDFAQSNQQTTSLGVTVTPFVEWYDSWGGFIARVFARTTTPGTAGGPNNYTYDSFTAGTTLAGRETDTQDQSWTVSAGTFDVAAGSAYPAGTGAKTIAYVRAALSCTQAVTFTQEPQSGTDTGLIFWWTSASSYWHAGTQGLYYYNGTTWTETAYTEGATFSPGDRIYVVTSQAGSPYIKVYKNIVSTAGLIASVTSATGVPSSSATVYSGIASEAV
jgi:hypothetical protein